MRKQFYLAIIASTALISLPVLNAAAAAVEEAAKAPAMHAPAIDIATEVKPLFIAGMRECDWEEIIKQLSQEKTSGNPRSLEDIRDIVARTQALFPTVENSPFAKCYQALTTPEVAGWAIKLAVCGFANTIKTERGLLADHVQALLTGNKDIFLKGCALNSFGQISDLKERERLIGLVHQYKIPDKYKVSVINVLYEEVPIAQQEASLQKIPTIAAHLGFDWSDSPEGDDFYFGYSIYTLAPNFSVDELQELNAFTRTFLGEDFDRKESLHLKREFTIALSKVPVSHRDRFVARIKVFLGIPPLDTHERHTITYTLQSSSWCKTLDVLEEFLSLVEPILPNGNKPPYTLFAFRNCQSLEDARFLTAQVLRFAKGQDDEKITDSKRLSKTLNVFGNMRDTGKEIVAEINELSADLAWQQRADLLHIVGNFVWDKKDRAKVVTLVKALTWEGDEHPTFNEQVEFAGKVSDLFDCGITMESCENIFGLLRTVTPQAIDAQSSSLPCGLSDVAALVLWQAPQVEKNAILKAFFKSIKYPNLGGVMSLASAQFADTVFPVKLNGFAKAEVISAIARIEESQRHSRIQMGHETAKAIKAEGEAYFKAFLESLTQ